MNRIDPAASRPDPDALLRETAPQARGRLKIFLGAAPGVGKTYEMLQSAHQRQRDGVDVVIGIVETHGRRETEALVSGIEAVPQKVVTDAHGRRRAEMDVDAILTRRPALVLVDELAHTNIAGSRHPKRHLDVEELLSAGIDVYTTLNIQHVASLNDVVAQITRVRVRETVPDAVLDGADDIEIVDLSPEELIQRLREGKVYVPEQAARAIDNFFSKGNLTALRELALRRTAERVDEQLRSHMQAHAIQGPWAAGERVLVCVSDDPNAPALVRYAKRTADRLHAPWTAVHVETPRTLRLGEAAQNRINEALRLADELGGEAVTIPAGTRIAESLLDHARAGNATHIVIGKSHRSRWFELVNGSVVHELVRSAGAISVHVIAGDTAAPAAPARTGRAARPDFRPRAFLGAVIAPALALLAAWLAEPWLGQDVVDLIFLVAVVAVAASSGLWPSLLASAIASLVYNFFFLPPVYTLTIAAPTNIASFFFFILVAFIVSNLAARVRAQMLAARHRARTTEALYSFSRKIAGVATLDDLLWAGSFQIASMLKTDVVFLLPDEGGLEVRSAYPPEDRLDEADIGAAKWAFESGRPAGRGSDTLAGARRLFLPLRTSEGTLGVVGLTRADGGAPAHSPDERRLLDALLDQISVAIERIQLAKGMNEARISAESERLRSALLTSLSHDLKTPLASITGAATSLREYGSFYEPAAREELVAMIESEARRLGGFVANLLDMARIEAGPIQLNRETVDIRETIATALRRVNALLGARKVTLAIELSTPLVSLDVVLFEQVLVNLLENAALHTPATSSITISTALGADALVLEVADDGLGIPEGEVHRIFEKFRRAGKESDARRAGTGLGLAIARGFTEALGGTIEASNRAGGGARFTIRFPHALLTRQGPEAAILE
jgi:two-component system sensor histidine kinase KdpD